jgi:hypothetical protein
MKSIRTLFDMPLALVAFVLLLVPVMLFAQSDTTATTPGALPTTADAVNLLLTLAIGFVTPQLMSALERLSSWMARQSPFVKRAVVSVIPALVMYGASALSHVWPWFPWDPTPLNAMIATTLAFGVHAGDTAKAAKVVAEETREMQGTPSA